MACFSIEPTTSAEEEEYLKFLDVHVPGIIDKKMRQVLCHICCAELGTTSLPIHQITCLKKHTWALDMVAHEEGVSREQASLNREMCAHPEASLSLPLPTAKDTAKAFDDYNKAALASFSKHLQECLYCRERNHEAVEHAKHAAHVIHHWHQADSDEEEARHCQEEDERNKLDEELLRRALEEAEEHYKAEEEELAHQQAEEEARRKHDEEVAAHEIATKRRIQEVEEEASRHHAEIEESLRTLKEKRDHALAVAEDVSRRHDMEQQHNLEEQRLKEEKEKKTHQKRLSKQELEEEDKRMMKILKEEEAARRMATEKAAREKRQAALSRRKFLRKHDGVLAATQSAAVYDDHKADEKAMDDIAHMSLAHAKHEHLVRPHHTVGGASFHASISVDEDDN
mmetsp:Transcript_10991/g.17944  ORF Transcript_10991/g.17944 Transcript_10991/m.17944 type:complete len:398 (-) Transcript_10991:2464-3657(-)